MPQLAKHSQCAFRMPPLYPFPGVYWLKRHPRTQLSIGSLGSVLHIVRSGPGGYSLHGFPGGTFGNGRTNGTTGWGIFT